MLLAATSDSAKIQQMQCLSYIVLQFATSNWRTSTPPVTRFKPFQIPPRCDVGATIRPQTGIGGGACQAGWSCLQIAGMLDFAIVGVIAATATVLADAQISIFTISTYNTDYIFVGTVDVEAAVRALAAAGHVVAAG